MEKVTGIWDGLKWLVVHRRQGEGFQFTEGRLNLILSCDSVQVPVFPEDSGNYAREMWRLYGYPVLPDTEVVRKSPILQSKVTTRITWSHALYRLDPSFLPMTSMRCVHGFFFMYLGSIPYLWTFFLFPEWYSLNCLGTWLWILIVNLAGYGITQGRASQWGLSRLAYPVEWQLACLCGMILTRVTEGVRSTFCG